MKILLLLLSLFLVSCNGEEHDSSEFSIVAVDFPSYDAARAVLGSDDNLTMLLPPGVESHGYEPTPKDMVRLSTADLVVYTGGPSDYWVSSLISTLDEPPELFLLVDQVELLDEERKEGMDGHDHGHDAFDEHVWTSPVNEARIIKNLCSVISTLDGENREAYERNSMAYIAKLETLDNDFRAIVADAPIKTLIFASRFPLLYFVREYGLDYYAAFPGCSEESEPSARTVTFLIDKAKELGVPVLLNIEMSSELIARTIAEEVHVPVRTFSAAHNVTSLEFKSGETYLSIMERNKNVLMEALGYADQR